MSKPHEEDPKLGMEKSQMTTPQEEFIGDEATPSKDVSEVEEGERPSGDRKETSASK